MMLENVDEKDKKRAEITIRWAVDKLAEEEEAAERNGVSRKPNGDTAQTRVRQGGQGMRRRGV